MKEKRIVDKNESTASLTLREVKRTALIRVVKTMAPLYKIYVVYFRTLVEKQNLGI